MGKYDNKPIQDIKECVHCESTMGFYTKCYASGWLQDNTLFTGEKYNMEMHDSLKYSRESKYYYCMECHSKIARVGNEC
jgi:hypothetical protein